jgi:putative heme transporter
VCACSLAEREAGDGVEERAPDRIPRSQVTVKTVFTVCAVTAAAVALILLILNSRIAITLTLGGILGAVAMEHAVQVLRRRAKLRRGPAIVVVMFALVAVLVGVGWLLIPPAVRQGRMLFQQVPDLWERLRQSRAFAWLDRQLNLQERLDELREVGPEMAERFLETGLRALGGVLAGIGGVLTILVLIAFTLGWGGPLIRRVLAETLPQRRVRYERVLRNVYGAVGGYLAGLASLAALYAVCTTIFLAIIRVPFFLPLGLAAGVGTLIPFVGSTLTGIVVTAVAFGALGTWPAVATAAYVIVYQQFENNVLAPLIYKRTVNVNPLVTLVGLMFAVELAGILGAFLAVPALAVIQILTRELLALRRERLRLPA